MSSGSTIRNPTNNLEAASASFPDLRWFWHSPLAWLIGVVLAWERRHQYRELLEFNDHLLADIGLSREDVEEVRRSPLYLLAWRDCR
ncbi:DUF1127 domain-containing protein [Bradyrhizobium sp.]|uniref:DUF1127 domain-containing protein n=1 Tax=Bradyrhizobium sp. TaxID=376 RepID=UPI003C71C2C4